MNEESQVRITLRLPEQLHRNLSENAARTSKSMNAEIIGRLEESVTGHATLHGLLDKLAGNVDRLDSAVSATVNMNRMLGYYVAELADRVPAHDETSAKVLPILKRVGRSLASGDVTSAREALVELNELGVSQGLVEIVDGKYQASAEGLRALESSSDRAPLHVKVDDSE